MIDKIRFLWIFFCFLLSFWRGLPLAALCTLLGDYFLLFTDDYALGISCFLLVQLVYLSHLRGHPFPWQAWLFLPLGGYMPVLLLGILYALFFSYHIFFALQKEKVQSSFSGGMYLLGLIFFLCCDITVAWGYFFTPHPRLIWLFYAPSQLILALTARVSKA